MEIEFQVEGNGARLELTSTGWEHWGRRARRARKGYSVGWAYILNVFAGQRTVRMSVLDAITALLNLVMKLRGGRDAEISRSGGEVPSAEQGG